MKPGKIFLYPLHLYPLGLLLVLTLLYSLLNSSLIAKFILSIIFIKYAYAILEDTALGHIKPLAINRAVLNDELELPFKQILLVFAIAAANVSILKNFGFTFFSISLTLSAVAFPANVMVLAMEHSFFSAFNPIMIVSIIKRIGIPYFFLTFLLMLLISASSSLMNMLFTTVSYTTYISLSAFINMYFTLTIFHLMGYTLFQYHEELGYNIEQSADNVDSTTTSGITINPELRSIEILIQEGKTDDANIKLEQMIRDNPTDHETRLKYLKLQQLLGNSEIYDKHAKKYISYLFDKQKYSRAFKTLQIVLIVNPSFKPANAIERFELAKQLKQNGQSKAAINLINNLHTEFPDFSNIPDAYLLAAKILCEQLGNDTQAKNILTFLQQKYPDHYLEQEIKDYLEIVSRLNHR